MLQRFAIYFTLIFLFAFTQIGAAAHEVSHLSDYSKHQQQDKNSNNEQCAQCLGFAQMAGGLQSQPFVIPSNNAHFEATSSYYFNAQTSLLTAYTARAPPQIIST
jgi:hypothetical protein